MKRNGRELIVEPGDKVRRHFEVAAWWQEIELEPGTYDLDNDPYQRGVISAVIPGRVVKEYFPPLFGGVAYGSDNLKENLDEPTTHRWGTYDWDLYREDEGVK